MTPGEPRGAPLRPASARDADPARREMLEDVLAGLAAPRKSIPPKYFYDEVGSRLFDEITELDEYYLTRAETAILRARAGEIAALLGPRALVVEFGSGSSVKTRILLEALDRPAAYVPVDISGAYLTRVARRLRVEHPSIPIQPVAADFTRAFALPTPPGPVDRRVVFFPGSTIGNFTPIQAQRLMARMVRLTGSGGAVLIGVDRIKGREALEAAYDDARGVTARFNLNVLERLNRELDADFDPAAFRHEAVWDADEARIEMRLVSEREQRVHLAGHTIAFRAGEDVLTEYSHKYTPTSFDRLARSAGLATQRVWTDPDERFSIHLLEPEAG